MPMAGRVHECRTSSDEISRRVSVDVGKTIRLSTSSSRGLPFVRNCSLIM